MTTETQKTHWKKNLDSRYISGEDLQAELHGLKPEMLVCIERFQDAETYDQNTNAKKTATGLWLKDVQSGTVLYKPVILNKTNAKFFAKECGSDYMEDWLGKTAILYAVKDSRHGYVVRFKAYRLPPLLLNTENFTKCRAAIKAGTHTLDQVKMKYSVGADVEKALLAE